MLFIENESNKRKQRYKKTENFLIFMK